MKKKVLAILSFPAPYRVGVFAELVKYYDIDVFFVHNSDEERSSEYYCKSGQLQFYLLNSIKGRMKYYNCLRKIYKYEYVIPYDAISRYARYAIYLCKLFGIPYFINCDGAILKRNVLRDCVKRILFKDAAACFASGKSAFEYFKYYGVPKNRIYIHNFTSLTAHDILSKPFNNCEKETLRNKLDIPNCQLVLAIGQFIHRKGFDILLKAWKKICHPATLLLIGGGGERSMYERLIQEFHFNNVIIHDFMPKQEIYRYYQAADIFVLPTREDIWGLVVNEAMAQGLPVITTDNCVAGVELIENGVNGYVVKTGSESELAEKINTLLEQPELVACMAENNVRKMTGWTMENVALRHREVIEKALLPWERKTGNG